MQQYYYVQRGDQQFGPYLSEVLLDYLAQGNIVLSDLVYLENSQSWISLDQAPLVQAFFGGGAATAATLINSESTDLPEVPKRPLGITPELNLEMIESAEVLQAAPVPAQPPVSAAETPATAVQTPTHLASSYDLTFTEGVASVEISPSTRGQLKVEINSQTASETESVRIEVQAARAARITVNAEETCTVGGQASVVVSALDEFGNVDGQCDAELSIKYSSSAMGVSRIQLKNGIGTFTVTNERATVSSFVVAGTGTWSDLAPVDGAIEFIAGPAIRFEILAPQIINAGTVSRIQVLARDRFGNHTSQIESDVKLAIQHFVS